MDTTRTFKNCNKQRRIAKAYLIAKNRLIKMGYADEIDWQYEASLEQLSEPKLLEESAWVILNSGMKETVVRKRFPSISNAFNDWESAKYISNNALECKKKALSYFNHKPKIDAIISIARRISDEGFSKIFSEIKAHGINYLRQFPFLGPVTSIHLAKNIGMDVAKPDRHLKRLASTIGYNSVQSLCEEISLITEDPVPVIDIVLWRISTLYKKKRNDICKWNVKTMVEALCGERAYK